MEAESASGWVPVFVPAQMAPEVLRSVAVFVESGSVNVRLSDWADATDEDMAVFFRQTVGLEWRLVAELARRERPAPVTELAQALGVEVGAVAGAIGPINKRAKREGWAAPIQPTKVVPHEGRAAKRGLVLAEQARPWVRARDQQLRQENEAGSR